MMVTNYWPNCDLCNNPATEELGTKKYCDVHYYLRLQAMEEQPQKPQPKRLRSKKKTRFNSE